MRRLIFIAAFFTGMCFNYFEALAQADRPLLSHLTSNEGLSFNTVLAIHQDERGFMYFQTWKGIDRYDGIEFQNFQCRPERYQQSGDCFMEDSLGNLWYGHSLARYNKAEGSHSLIMVSSHDELREVADIENILLVSDHLLYLHTYEEIMTLDPYSDEPGLDTIFSLKSNPPFNRIIDIQFGMDDYLWMATEKGFFRYNRSLDTILSFDLLEYPGNRYIHDFMFDLDGNLWAAFSHDLIRYDFQQGTNMIYQLSGLDRTVFKEVYQTGDGTIWLGTVEKGLYYLEPGQDRFKCLIDYSSISAIYEDRSHRLWIGTENAGIFLLDSLRNSFRQLQVKLEDRTITSFHVNNILSNDRSGLWISSESFGLLFHDLETKKTTVIDAENINSKMLYLDKQDRIWYNSLDFLLCYDPDMGSIRKIRHPVQDQFPVWNYGNSIINMYRFHDKLILCSDRGEVYAFDPNNEEFTLILDNKDSPIRAIFPDKDTLWLALYSLGIVRMDSSLTIIDTLYHDNTETGVMEHAVMAIHRDRFDSLWIGGYGGLCKLNPNTREFEGVFGFHGSSGYVVSIQEDQQGNLWIGSSNGIYKYERERQRYKLMDANHGLPTGRFFMNAFAQTPDGKMYFGGNNGIVYFHPEDVRFNSVIPPVLITGFQVNVAAKRRPQMDMQDPFTGDIQQRKIRLKYWQNSFTINYASLNYTSPRYNQYQYRLVGLDDQWNLVGNRSEAIYTNLRGGNYVFQVMGSNNEGLWNEEACTLSIQIDRPPWFSWGAIFLYACLLLSLIMLIYLYNVRRIRLQHQLEMQSKESESLQEIDRAKSRFFTSISHEFRTPLTLILDPATQLLKDDETKPRQLRFINLIIKNSQRLLFLINQILDLAKLNSSQIQLKVEEIDLPRFLRPIAESFSSRAESLGLGYRILVPHQPVRVWIDRERIQQVVINLLSNAFKFCTRGEIILEIEEEKDSVCIRVKDSGIGIPGDQIEHIFENFYQVESPYTKDMAGTGVGLYLVEQLVQLHHGSVEVKSEMDKGSIFSVRLLKGKDHFRPEQVVREPQIQSDVAVPDLENALQGERRADQLPGNIKPTLLILEDNPEMGQYLEDVLSDEYLVYLAKNGSEGFEKALKLNPQLVISDVMMPVMDGYAYCEKMKKDIRTSHIPVILLTAKNMHEDKIKGLEQGADDYLQKPFHLDELKLRIHNHLEQRKNLHKQFLRDFKINTGTEIALSVNDHFLQKAFLHIEEYLHDDQFGVEKLSKLSGMSRKHLNNKIKSLTDQTTNELIRSFRLRKAAYLISEKGISVSEACYEVGFNNLSYFSKCFTDFYGIRPSEYRK